MEIRARYVLIGLFVLAAIFAGFGFVYWLNNTAGIGPRTTYRIAFDGSVSGLTPGSPVLFNGLTVGEVTSLALVADRPGRVLATIAVDSETPVRTDSHVGLDFRGLTGTATVSLSGGTPNATFPPGEAEPMLVADANAMKDLTASARGVLDNIDTLINQNSGPVTDAIANIDTFSTALAKNSDKVEGIMKGLAKLAGADSDVNLTNYDLTAPAKFPALAAAPTVQLALPIPTAVITTDSQRINVETADGEEPGFPSARWADNVPQLVRARVIQAFQNAGYMKVGSDDGSLTGDYKLAIDIRRFRISNLPGPTAEVSFGAQLIDTNGTVADAKIFTATEPVAKADDAAAAAKAIDAAFGKIEQDMIAWALPALDAAPRAAAGGAEAPPPADNAPAPPTDAPTDGTNAPPAEPPPADAPADTTAQ